MPDPKGMDIFQRFIRTAPPDLWPSATGSHQGLYVMTPDGDYLYGKFASPTNENARDIIIQGWNAWQERAVGSQSKPVPTARIPIVGGMPLRPDYLKLRVSYRDLPRGNVERPGDAQFPNPYNLGWFDIRKDEAYRMIYHKDASVWRRIILKCMKDAVRGQMTSWRAEHWRGGQFDVEFKGANGPYAIYRIHSTAELGDPEKGTFYSATIFGHVVYHTTLKDFADFQVLAVGQRQGAGASNGRASDLGPAPMAVALRMFR